MWQVDETTGVPNRESACREQSEVAADVSHGEERNREENRGRAEALHLRGSALGWRCGGDECYRNPLRGE